MLNRIPIQNSSAAVVHAFLLSAIPLALLGCSGGTRDSGSGSGQANLGSTPTGCVNTCGYASDGLCDDGGAGADSSACDFGTDCVDCGLRGAGLLGRGIDQNADPEEFGRKLAAEIEALGPGEDVLPTAVLPSSAGPRGSLLGYRLDNGNSLFVLGTMGHHGDLDLTAAVLEDSDGNLLLMREDRRDGFKITQATGDAVDFEMTGTDSMRITYTLNGTVPPSVIAVDFVNGAASVDERLSSFSDIENTDYNQRPIRLAREDVSHDVGLVVSAFSAGDRQAAGWAESVACVASDGSIMVIDFACAVYDLATSGAPKLTVKSICAAANLALESFRNSLPVPGLSGPTLMPRAVALIKMGLASGCYFAGNIVEFGSAFAKIAPPGAICLVVTMTEESVRLSSPTGASPSQQICDALGIAPPPPELPPIAEQEGCTDTCAYARDGMCDDGAPDSDYSVCDYGTDCQDCGVRSPEEPPETEDCFDEGICNPNCPDFEPDVECTNEQLCAAKGLCCVGDATCDLWSCNFLDEDCTNFNICHAVGTCCDDDDRCDTRTGLGAPCPTTDRDCLYCGNYDEVCIENCVPEDPDCGDGPAKWTRVDTRVNPNDGETNFVGGGAIPYWFPDHRYLGKSATYTVTETSISVHDVDVDYEFEEYNVTLRSDFDEPPAELIPGQTISLQVDFSHSGTVTIGNPGFTFSYSSDNFGINPGDTFGYAPWNPEYAGGSSATYGFLVPATRDGQIELRAGWGNCQACVVAWVYEAGQGP